MSGRSVVTCAFSTPRLGTATVPHEGPAQRPAVTPSRPASELLTAGFGFAGRGTRPGEIGRGPAAGKEWGRGTGGCRTSTGRSSRSPPGRVVRGRRTGGGEAASH